MTATATRGFNISPMLTLVSPAQQASLWKQGRTAVDAELKVLALHNAHAVFLSETLRMAKAQETNLVTDQLPGNSWFQWGEAIKVVWIDKWGHLVPPTKLDNYDGPPNGYHAFAEECVKQDLYVINHGAGAQLRKEEAPLDVYSWQEINQEMTKRFRR